MTVEIYDKVIALLSKVDEQRSVSVIPLNSS